MLSFTEICETVINESESFMAIKKIATEATFGTNVGGLISNLRRQGGTALLSQNAMQGGPSPAGPAYNGNEYSTNGNLSLGITPPYGNNFNTTDNLKYDKAWQGQGQDPNFKKLLNQISSQLGKPFYINSGYRTPEYNAKVSDTGTTGPHTEGTAADISTAGWSDKEKADLINLASAYGIKGIGIYKNFIHLDTSKYGVRTWGLTPSWATTALSNHKNQTTYRAAQLARQSAGTTSGQTAPVLGGLRSGPGGTQTITTPKGGTLAWSSITPQQIQPGQWTPAIATAFGYIPKNNTLVRDTQDNQSGAYIGPYGPQTQGASLSRAALASWGLTPQTARNYDVVVTNGIKTIRVPLIDLGPAEWVERRQGHTIDLTGAAHLALGTTGGKDKVSYRVVQRQ